MRIPSSILVLVLVVVVAQCVTKRSGHDSSAPQHDAAVPGERDADVVLRILEDGSLVAGGLDTAAEASVEQSDREVRKALEAWLEQVAEGMSLSATGPRAQEHQVRAEAARRGPLLVRAHQAAPFSRVLMVLDACTEEGIGIDRVHISRDGTGGNGWAQIELKELSVPVGPRSGDDDLICFHGGVDTLWVGPIDFVDIDMASSSGEVAGSPGLIYRIGGSDFESIESMSAFARKLDRRDQSRRWVVRTNGDISWGCVAPVLELLRDIGVVPFFVYPGERSQDNFLPFR